MDVRSPGTGVPSVCGLLYVSSGNQTCVFYRSIIHSQLLSHLSRFQKRSFIKSKLQIQLIL